MISLFCIDGLFSGAPGELTEVELDTNHFLGNFPESCEIHAVTVIQPNDWSDLSIDSLQWTEILPRTKLGPHRQHYFELENVEKKTYTHVKVTIFPDGGLKRIRIMGRKTHLPLQSSSTKPIVIPDTIPISTPSLSPMSNNQSQITIVPVVPLTAEAFAPFGQVIQAYSKAHPARDAIKITSANGGTAEKFHKLSLPVSTYPKESNASTAISVYRCDALLDISDGVSVLRTLERHPYTNQAFIPMGSGSGEGLEDPANTYLVVVAHNGSDDRPDMQTLKAFVATASQGISYNTGVWRKCLRPSLPCPCTEPTPLDQPMTVLHKVSEVC